MTFRAMALDPTEHLSELHHTQWLARDGGPAQINDIAQTTDGYLWLGCGTGLLRFDGVRFELYRRNGDGAPITGDVTAVYATPTGDLWIGMRLGVAFLLRNGKVIEYGALDGLPMHTIFRFARQSDGTIWAQTIAGLYRLENNHWSQAAKDWALPPAGGTTVFVDADGTLWSRGDAGTFALTPRTHSFLKASIPGGLGYIDTGPGNIAWASDESLGLIALSGAPQRIDGGDLGARSSSGATLHGTGGAYVDRDGALWAFVQVGEVNTLIRVPEVKRWLGGSRDLLIKHVERLPASKTLSSPDGITNRIFEDSEGNIWITTLGGIDRFRSNKLHALPAHVEKMRDPALAVGAGGSVWISDGRVSLQVRPHGLPLPMPNMSFVQPNSGDIASIYVESDTSIWVGGESEGLPLTHIQNGVARQVSLPGAESLRVAQSITQDRDEALWVSFVSDGVYRREGEQWVLNGGIPALPKEPALALARHSNGDLWFSYANNRIATMRNGKVDKLGTSEGLNTGYTFVMNDADDRVWVGGTDNVDLYKNGRFTTLIRTDGSAITGATGIVQDQGGGLWINGSNGVIHVTAADINTFERDPNHFVATETINFEDGLVGIAEQLRPIPTAALGGDGRIWFATNDGVYWIDPAHIQRNLQAPTIIIQTATVSDKTYPVNREIGLPKRTSSFSVEYTATSLTMPNRVQFRYRLDDVDKDWRDAGGRRQAFYTNVPPGNHKFSVIASNEDGIWSTHPATITVLIPAAFYQTGWFYMLCTFFVILAIFQLYRLRLHQQADRLRAAISVRTDERERLARDLNDTLLQGSQGLILLFQGFAGRLTQTDPTRREMESVLDRADRLLKEARDRVGDLRISDVSGDTSERISRFGLDLTARSQAQFSMVISGDRRALPASVADELYQIAREAISNAVRHSDARHIEAHTLYDAEQFTLRISDDGEGVALNVMRGESIPGHYGIQGMRERALRIGATFTISRHNNNGTDVEVVLPAKRAYTRRWV